ncbi:MAG: flagellar hook-length control protein FliK [Proteobacteria bacterium]|nr:flagellar hook-length control protein FliK [Pseudomonadota bacterium]
MAISSARATATSGALSLKGAAPATSSTAGRLPQVAAGTPTFAPEGIAALAGSGSATSRPPAAPGAQPATGGKDAAPAQAPLPAPEPTLAQDLTTNLQSPAPKDPAILDAPAAAADTPVAAGQRAAQPPQAQRARAKTPPATATTTDPALALLAVGAPAPNSAAESAAAPPSDGAATAATAAPVNATAAQALDALLALSAGTVARAAPATGTAAPPKVAAPEGEDDPAPEGPAPFAHSLATAMGTADAVTPATAKTSSASGEDATTPHQDSTPDPAPLSGTAAPGAGAALANLAAAGAAEGAAAGAATSSAVAATIHTPVGASGWTDEVGAHVVWLAHQGVTEASLRLQPEHLGPVEVKISVHDDSASVWFGASTPETRTALQQALPQLRDLFAAQGMTLTDAGVSREAPRDAQPAPRPSGSGTQAQANAQNANAVAVPVARRGLIDTYA